MKILVVNSGSAEVRRRSVRGLGFFGVEIGNAKNEAARGEAEISAAGSRVRTFAIPTNEELVIARDTKELVLAVRRT
jgi:acetate kinase